MIISNIDLYEILSDQLGKEKARNLVTFVEAKVEDGLNEKTALFATKEDIARLETKIAESKTDMIKWFVGFFITLIVMIVGLYIKK